MVLLGGDIMYEHKDNCIPNNIATPEILQMVDPQIQEKITIEYEW